MASRCQALTSKRESPSPQGATEPVLGRTSRPASLVFEMDSKPLVQRLAAVGFLRGAPVTRGRVCSISQASQPPKSFREIPVVDSPHERRLEFLSPPVFGSASTV